MGTHLASWAGLEQTTAATEAAASAVTATAAAAPRKVFPDKRDGSHTRPSPNSQQDGAGRAGYLTNQLGCQKHKKRRQQVIKQRTSMRALGVRVTDYQIPCMMLHIFIAIHKYIYMGYKLIK